ncbi:MAG: exodeoxyribonuclease VII small subunit [Planctomycetes bacterium]|nr:exodeoxyribonuclease VII small subunit [Planctomycetota bacterium]
MTLPNEPTPRPDPGRMSYEEAIGELESIIDSIEQGQVGLQQSLAEYSRGAALLKRCRTILDDAEQQVERLAAEEAQSSPEAGAE